MKYTPEEKAFLTQLRHHPEDDTTRNVYADWLDDRGDPRGPLVRGLAEFNGRKITEADYQQALLKEPANNGLRWGHSLFDGRKGRSKRNQKIVQAFMRIDSMPELCVEKDQIKDNNWVLYNVKQYVNFSNHSQLLLYKGTFSKLHLSWPDAKDWVKEQCKEHPIEALNLYGQMANPVSEHDIATIIATLPETISTLAATMHSLGLEPTDQLNHMRALIRAVAQKDSLHELELGSLSEMVVTPIEVETLLQSLGDIKHLHTLRILYTDFLQRAESGIVLFKQLSAMQHLEILDLGGFTLRNQEQNAPRLEMFAHLPLPNLRQLNLPSVDSHLNPLLSGLEAAYRHTIETQGANPSMINLEWMNGTQISKIPELEALREQALAARQTYEKEHPTETLQQIEEFHINAAKKKK